MRPAVQVRRYAILFHRWMGVALCVLFAAWFVSGIVLMYWGYPVVRDRDRLARDAPLDAGRIRISPAEAFAALNASEPPSEIRISTFDARPAYRFQFGPDALLVYADTGQLRDEFPPDLTLRVASEWTGRPAALAKFEGALTTEDQWTVSGEFRDLRPLMKYSWHGEEVYVSGATGEVVQYTTRASRLGAWFGAIPHWLYFTPLRRQGAIWNRVVVWSSGIGTVASVLGLVVGLLLYSPRRRRYRFPEGRSSIPYAGQKRWHTILGLLFGAVTCTWVFSGMLSMDPFGWDRPASERRLQRVLAGKSLDPARFTGLSPGAAIEQSSSQLHVKELELAMIGGEPVYIARESPERSLLIPLHGPPSATLDPARLTRVIAAAVAPAHVSESRVVTRYEAYYVDRHHDRPLPVLFARLDDPDQSMYYIDLKTGRIEASYVGISRWNRWLYHGLHSFDLPWLYRHRPAWDIVVLLLMAGGTALSVTSVVIGWRRLRRKLREVRV